MADELQQLHVIIFPFMAQGHILPALDIAKLFAARGVKATIITTPLNLPFVTKAIKKSIQLGSSMIQVEAFRFPSTENGLPDECENVSQAMKINMVPNFMKAVEMLKEQLEPYLEKIQPTCLVADMFLTWTTDSAAKFNIPRLVFHGVSYFALCAEQIIMQYKPYMNVSSDDEHFRIPFLPDEINMTRLEIAEEYRKEELNEFKREYSKIKESEVRSFGVIVNSFYELEPKYADFFSKELGRRAWHIGPVSLCNRSIEDKAQRGQKQASRDEDECLIWLNSKLKGSIIYICFGSLNHVITSQLHEIAMALEASEQEFIWVVKDVEDDNSEDWFLSEFKQRMEGKGLILRGWAPQLLILEHEAIGAFVTYCGWNSILEGICAGVPMVTWPSFAEQFYNEKLVTEILRIGVPIGVKKWSIIRSIHDLVKRDAIHRALQEIMEGDEAQERKKRAKMLKEMAMKAVEEDGSSSLDLEALINELRHQLPC